MNKYLLKETIVPTDKELTADEPAVLVMTSEELEKHDKIEGLERTLHHAPSASDARVCKAEVRSDCLCGTLVIPRSGKNGGALNCGYLITKNKVVLVDDTNIVRSYLKHMIKEKRWVDFSVGRFLYNFFEQLISKDLHRLEELEDRAQQLEDDVLAHRLDSFSVPMTEIRKETMTWLRYYSQLDDVACELHENENGFFTQPEQLLFKMFEERVIRLRERSQFLREYCSQIQSMFQSEIDIKQNRIMQILTIVTTVFLPLSLIVGWYGMNFAHMPELHWKYGYPMVIAVSSAVVVINLIICKKKKFW